MCVCLIKAFLKHVHEWPSQFGKELFLDQLGKTKSPTVGRLIFSTAECFGYVWIREHSLDKFADVVAALVQLIFSNGVQNVYDRCMIAWLRWRLSEANWCFSDFMCDTSTFTPSVPKLRVLLQSTHCASKSLLSMAFKQLKSDRSSQHWLHIHFPIVVADSV